MVEAEHKKEIRKEEESLNSNITDEGIIYFPSLEDLTGCKVVVYLEEAPENNKDTSYIG